MLISPSIGQTKREILQKYEKTNLFKVRIFFFLLTLFRLLMRNWTIYPPIF